jgi:putative SOS response-associated peptidase YedK
MVLTDSNPLIHPMSEKMPVILNNETLSEWLQLKGNPTRFLNEFKNPLLLTDFSVLRVSKKVNDPDNNDAKLIQPIPK